MKKPIAILGSQIDQHPASLAWQQINGGNSIPEVIEVLKQNEKSLVYRLRGGTPDTWTIIAKRCGIEAGKLELAIYEEFLSFLPVSALHCYGGLYEAETYIWIFLEDAGTRRFSIADGSHRSLAAHWLGALHHSAVQNEAAQRLPERGPAYYLELMQRGREYIVKGLPSSVVSPKDLDVLHTILRQMDALESNWPELLKICQDIPQTLIHGDFRSKNIYIKQKSMKDVLCVIDWEMAGWGLPPVDLAPSRGLSTNAQVNLSVYLSMARQFWQNLDMPSLQYYIHVGCIFRRLAAMYWSSLEFQYDSVEKPIPSMYIFHKELTESILAVFGKELVNGRRT